MSQPMVCPRCGFSQEPSEECGRCGVVFRKAHAAPPPSPAPAAADPAPAPRRFPWIPAALLVAAAFLLQARFGTKDGGGHARAVPRPRPRRAAGVEQQPAFQSPRPVPPAPDPPAPGGAPPPEAPAAPAREERGFVPVSGWYDGADGFRQADEERQRYGKPMAVYFHTDWCGWCKRMDRDYLESSETSAYLDTLAKVRINPENGAEEAALARRFGVNGYPAFYIVPAGGGGGRRVHPFFRNGAMSAADFVSACRRSE